MRPLRLLSIALLAALAGGVLATPAGAAPGDPLGLIGPAGGARLTAPSAVPLQAVGVPGDTGIELRVSRSPAPVDACGRIDGEVAVAGGTPDADDPATFDFALGGWFDAGGTYYWQASRLAGGSCAATEIRSVTIVPRTSVPAAAGLSTQLIPRRIGSSNGATFTIRTSGLPPSVTRSRYLALVRNAGARWRLHSAGPQPGRPVFGNGRSEVGFSTSQVPPEALAVTIVGRRRFGGTRERDLILRADIPWEEGPDHPTRARVDLETVLLHEFGHFAGNGFHVPRGCTNSPMVVGLASGEWWRSTADFSYRAC